MFRKKGLPSTSKIEKEFNKFLKEASGGDPEKERQIIERLGQGVDRLKPEIDRVRFKHDITVLPPEDPSGKTYPVFPKNNGGCPYEFLKNHEVWAPRLKHFNTGLDRDYLYLDQLGHLDPGLKSALYSKRRSIKTETGLDIPKIVPAKTVRMQQQQQDADTEELNRLVSLYAKMNKDMQP